MTTMVNDQWRLHSNRLMCVYVATWNFFIAPITNSSQEISMVHISTLLGNRTPLALLLDHAWTIHKTQDSEWMREWMQCQLTLYLESCQINDKRPWPNWCWKIPLEQITFRWWLSVNPGRRIWQRLQMNSLVSKKTLNVKQPLEATTRN